MACLTELFLDTIKTHGESSVSFADPKVDAAQFQLGGLTVGQERMTYKELYEDARKILGGLRKAGLQAGDHVIVQLNKPTDIIRTFWACVFGGFVPAPLPISASYKETTGALLKLQAAYQLLNLPKVICDEQLAGELATAAVPLPEITERLVKIEECAKATPADNFHYAQEKDLALLMFTSGSTGNAKGVMLTHYMMLRSMKAKAKALDLNDKEMFCNWTALDHVAGLLDCHLLPISLGASQLHVNPGTVLTDPMRLLQLIAHFKVTTTFAPNFLFKLINVALSNAEASPCMDLSSLKVLISGGESVVTKTAAEFLEAGKPFGLKDSVVRPAFGMTETSAGITFSNNFPACDANNEFAGLGPVMDGVKLRIVSEEDGTPFEQHGQAGALQVTGETVFGGYIYNEAATAEAFAKDGWFDTGDRGMIDEDGSLRLLGRNKDSIIINGANFYSHEIEACLTDADGVVPSCIAAIPHRAKGADSEAVVLLTAIQDGEDPRRVVLGLRDTCASLFGFRTYAICVLKPEQFPKSSLGKILRSALRKQFDAGEFPNALAEFGNQGPMVAPRNDDETTMVKIWGRTLDLQPEEISVTSNFLDLGGTSVDVIKYKTLVDAHWKVDMPVTWPYLHPTPETMVVAVLKLASGDTTEEYRPIIQLNATGDKTPLFLVHPGVGEVLVFTELAKRFRGDRPVYAFRARGFEQGQEFFKTMDEMATVYTDAMMEVQPHGPYYISGYSYGGVVAFEVAKKAEERGEQVHFCGLLNIPPHIKPRMWEIQYLDGLLNLMLFVDLLTKEQTIELNETLKELSNEEATKAACELSNQARMEELQLTPAKLQHWTMLAASLIDCGKYYDPAGSVCTVSSFYAIPLRGTKQEWVQGPLAAWKEFCRTDIEYIEVPGHHYTLMSPQHVDDFVKIFRAAIDRAAVVAEKKYTEEASK